LPEGQALAEKALGLVAKIRDGKADGATQNLKARQLRGVAPLGRKRVGGCGTPGERTHESGRHIAGSPVPVARPCTHDEFLR
jgi:hypothetical protein